MKALSLTQPWATLVAIGAKRIETRSWSTRYRGPIAIHASSKFPSDCRRLCWDEPFRSVLAAAELVDYGAYCDLEPESMERFFGLPLGAVLAIGDITGVAKTEVVTGMSQGLLAHEIEFGDYSPGRSAWVFRNVVRLVTPIPIKGALGLWTVPCDLVEQIGAQEGGRESMAVTP